MSDLVKIENTTPMEIDGLEGFGVRVATVKLTQGMTKGEDVQPGVWMNTMDGSTSKEITVIPLAITVNRSFYPAGTTDFSGPPICFSNDGIRPSSNCEQQQATLCGNCSKQKWGPNKQKPECSKGYRLLALTAEDLLPVNMYFRKSATKPFEMFGELLKAKIVSARNKGQGNLNLRDFQITIGIKTITEKGKYYVPVFKEVKPHGKDVEAEYVHYTSRNIVLSDENELEQELEENFEQV